jgi:hypothetical protein
VGGLRYGWGGMRQWQTRPSLNRGMELSRDSQRAHIPVPANPALAPRSAACASTPLTPPASRAAGTVRGLGPPVAVSASDKGQCDLGFDRSLGRSGSVNRHISDCAARCRGGCPRPEPLLAYRCIHACAFRSTRGPTGKANPRTPSLPSQTVFCRPCILSVIARDKPVCPLCRWGLVRGGALGPAARAWGTPPQTVSNSGVVAEQRTHTAQGKESNQNWPRVPQTAFKTAAQQFLRRGSSTHHRRNPRQRRTRVTGTAAAAAVAAMVAAARTRQRLRARVGFLQRQSVLVLS